MWFMKGSVSLEQAYQLTPKQREKITDLMKHQAEANNKAKK